MTAKLLLAPLMLIIRLYQWCVSPFTAAQCRYHPTCSAYAAEAVETHGVYGVWLALKRLARCHPWGGHGYDPVPQRKLERTPHATSTK